MADEQLHPSDEIPQIHDENFSTIYSDWIQAGRTPWDIKLAFGQLRETAPDKPAIAHMVHVVMAPQMAKALIATLALTINQYEDQNGEIPIPLSIKQKMSASVSPSPSLSSSLSPSSSASPSAEPSEED